jgi:hypothetical protein
MLPKFGLLISWKLPLTLLRVQAPFVRVMSNLFFVALVDYYCL